MSPLITNTFSPFDLPAFGLATPSSATSADWVAFQKLPAPPLFVEVAAQESGARNSVRVISANDSVDFLEARMGFKRLTLKSKTCMPYRPSLQRWRFGRHNFSVL